MLSGDQRILCEKPQYMSDSRQSVPSAKYFFRHAPDNVYVTELRGSAQEFCGWQAAVAYVLPFESPATRMDSESAERFLDLLRAKDRDPLQTACRGRVGYHGKRIQCCQGNYPLFVCEPS